ncbi:hypothetical protein ACP4OV_016720 [Aristida adscensionis]
MALLLQWCMQVMVAAAVGLQVTVVQAQHAVAGGRVPVLPAVVVLGDSWADTGNNNFIQTMARGNYPPYGRDFAGGEPTGRFSNGRLPADFVSEALGLPPAVPPYLDPRRTIHDLASGVSFASAGSGLDDTTAQMLHDPNLYVQSAVTLRQQVEHLKEYKARLRRARGRAAGERTIRQALYLLSVGGSDLLGNYLLYPLRRQRFTLHEYSAYLAGEAEAAVRAVHAVGARRVAVAGLPPLGCLPLQRTVNAARPGDCNWGLNTVARSFNRRLRAAAAKLNGELPGARVVYVDQYRVLAEMITKPWEYGFENSVRGCCGTGYVETGVLCSIDSAWTCKDADKYVFFDAVHPSQRAYKMVADAILNATWHTL